MGASLVEAEEAEHRNKKETPGGCPATRRDQGASPLCPERGGGNCEACGLLEEVLCPVDGPATLGIACASVFFAPLGVRLAHALPVATLRRFFAVFLYVTACEMLWTIFH